MKAVLSLTLTICLLASALSEAGQEPLGTAGPPAGAVEREVAGRLNPASESPTPVMRFPQAGGNHQASDWSSVRALAPGTQIVITLKGSPRISRLVVVADESELVLVNMTSPSLSQTTTGALIDMLVRHPEHFAGPPVPGRLESGDVSVGRDGLFVSGRKVAEFDQLVERVSRTNVAEITRPRPRRSTGHGVGLGVVGYVAGAMGGGIFGLLISGSSRGMVVGFLVGAVGGAILGYRNGSRGPEDVIYRAP